MTLGQILNTPQQRSRIETIILVFVLSGAWISAGYMWGVASKVQRVEIQCTVPIQPEHK